jgi:hypothetical protein
MNLEVGAYAWVLFGYPAAVWVALDDAIVRRPEGSVSYRDRLAAALITFPLAALWPVVLLRHDSTVRWLSHRRWTGVTVRPPGWFEPLTLRRRVLYWCLYLLGLTLSIVGCFGTRDASPIVIYLYVVAFSMAWIGSAQRASLLGRTGAG